MRAAPSTAPRRYASLALRATALLPRRHHRRAHRRAGVKDRVIHVLDRGGGQRVSAWRRRTDDEGDLELVVLLGVTAFPPEADGGDETVVAGLLHAHGRHLEPGELAVLVGARLDDALDLPSRRQQIDHHGIMLGLVRCRAREGNDDALVLLELLGIDLVAVEVEEAARDREAVRLGGLGQAWGALDRDQAPDRLVARIADVDALG